MKKNIFEWMLYFFLLFWQLPQNLVGLAMLIWFASQGKVSLIDRTKWSYAFMSKHMSGGISLGTFCFVSEKLAKQPEGVAHELKGHTWDSRLFGPLYLLIIGLPSIMNAAIGFTKCYYDFYPEAWANKHAGLTAEENCQLKFKKE